MFEYINRGSEPDNIYTLFYSFTGDMKFIVTDGGNKVYDKKISEFPETPSCSYPTYIVYPNDTLRIPFPLNSFGLPAPVEEEYFEFGHFPEGKYRAHAFFDNDCFERFDMPIRSNEIEFEVRSLTDIDIDVLSLYKQKKFDIIFNDFKDNAFTEHIMKNYVINTGSLKDSIAKAEAYQNFFHTYPSSIYNMDFHHIYFYLARLSNTFPDLQSIKSRLAELLLTYPDLISSQYLRSGFVDSQIEYLVKMKESQDPISFPGND